MTFVSEETSIQDARPVELLDIRLDNTVFPFINSEDEITFNFVEYKSAPFRRSQPKVNQDQAGSEIEISMPTNAPSTQLFARKWVTQPPETRTTKVTLFKHHVDDPSNEFQIFWVGTIVSIGYEDNGTEMVMLCKSLDNLFTLQGPRKNWGNLCNHQLYDSECLLSEPLFTQTGTVTVVGADGVSFTIPGLAPPVVRFVSGEMRTLAGVDGRLIVKQVGDVFTVQYPVPTIIVGTVVEVIEGCDHSLTDCEAFPNTGEPSGTNVENFGGAPFQPPINPYEKGLDAI